MVANRNTVVIALMSMFIGAMASIGALQYAQVISMSGMDPNAAKELTLQKQSPSCVNPRSIMLNLFNGTRTSRPCPAVRDAAADRNTMHGAPAVVEAKPGCDATENARRRVKCNEDISQGAARGLTNETTR